MCTSRLNELDLDICQRTPAAAPVIRGGRFGFSRNLKEKEGVVQSGQTLSQSSLRGSIILENTTQINPHSDCQCEYLTLEPTASQILYALCDD